MSTVDRLRGQASASPGHSNTAIAQGKTMNWERADQAKIDEKARYLVLTNGAAWRDNDVELWHGLMVQGMLDDPDYVRGRPVWIAKVIRPTENAI